VSLAGTYERPKMIQAKSLSLRRYDRRRDTFTQHIYAAAE